MLTKIHAPPISRAHAPPGVNGPVQHIGVITYRHGSLFGKRIFRIDLFRAIGKSAVWFDCVHQQEDATEPHKWSVINENMQLMHYLPEYKEVPLEELPATIAVMGLLDKYFAYHIGSQYGQPELVSCLGLNELGYKEYKRLRGMPV